MSAIPDDLAAMEGRRAARREAPPLAAESQPPNFSDMKPLTHEAYGGGMYGKDDGDQKQLRKKPASETQSSDGLVDRLSDPPPEPKHTPPPSTGDRDLDITGQSYIG